MASTDTALHGRTFKWKFTDGPTAGKIYEHTFAADGTVAFREAAGAGAAKPAQDTAAKDQPAQTKPAPDTPAPKTKFASFEVAPGIHLVSYLSGAGYTLTTCMNLATKRLHGFASNDKEWYPLTGTLEP